jgi:hypothetical protein
MTMTVNHNVMLRANASTAHASVLARLAALQKMSSVGLRSQWDDLCKTPIPKSYNDRMLIKRLAHRIQELEYGGDSQETKARLEQLASRHCKSDKRHDVAMPMAGTVLVREYQGVEYQVLVLEDGKFQYDGCIYNSLSAIAKRIAGGTSWNGKIFFGLKERATSKRSYAKRK